ncbi:MAG: stage IV sporulation protein A [Clostridia bacterium]|nr:stage IV sporulation protein A [Clostridia bacterium]
MNPYNIYHDIASRTNGDLYVGVVGPVRVGKSTFITKFMEQFVLPNITEQNLHACALDELPQSADGNTIMTTQPKFVPAQSVRVDLGNNVLANVRMIDCVGYLVAGAQGHLSPDGKTRMVKTPWSDEEMPFERAAELGTSRVVTEHCNVAVLLTTDGSFGEIPRQNYVPAEERLVRELREHNKPFVIAVNSAKPKSQETKDLVLSLQQKYNVGVLAINASELNEKDVANTFDKILQEFPIVSVEINMPQWMTALPFDNQIITEVAEELKRVSNGVTKIGEFDKGAVLFEESERFEPLVLSAVEMGEGRIVYDLMPKEGLFYQVLSMQCGMNINNDFELIAQIRSLAQAKMHYDKMKDALAQVSETGYGVVQPSLCELELDEPQIVKQGAGRYGVKIKATAPSLHIMRVDLETEINPLVGTEQQSQDLVNYLNTQALDNPDGIWETNMFGKTMHQLMSDGIAGKLNAMPVEAQKKMRKALSRIVNEGKGGIICILL